MRPPYSDFLVVCSRCGCTCTIVPALGMLFLNHWAVAPTAPVILTVSWFIAFFLKLKAQKYITGHVPAYILVWQFICWTLYLMLYGLSIVVGPGYLPWYYKDELQRYLSNGEVDHWSGIVTSEEQKEWANGEMPPRVRFFSTAKRYVITADHFCVFMGSFVGRRNYKLFFWLHFWGLQTTLTWFVAMFQYHSKFRMDTGLWITKQVSFEAVVLIIITLIGIYLAVSHVAMMFQCLFVMLTNVTVFDFHYARRQNPKFQLHWRERAKHRRKNFQYFCGPNVWTWFLPIPAFWGIDDYTLARLDNDPDDIEETQSFL